MSAVKAQTDLSTRPPLHVVPPLAGRRRNANGAAGQSFAAITIDIDTVAVERC